MYWFECEMYPFSLWYLNIWFPFGDAVWRGYGEVQPCWGSITLGVGLEII